MEGKVDSEAIMICGEGELFEKCHTKTHQTQTGVAQSLCLSCCCWLLVCCLSVIRSIQSKRVERVPANKKKVFF